MAPGLLRGQVSGSWPRKGRVHLMVTWSGQGASHGSPLACPGPHTFRQPQLLQFTGQGLAIHAMLGRTGEDETQYCHSGFHIAQLWGDPWGVGGVTIAPATSLLP